MGKNSQEVLRELAIPLSRKVFRIILEAAPAAFIPRETGIRRWIRW